MRVCKCVRTVCVIVMYCIIYIGVIFIIIWHDYDVDDNESFEFHYMIYNSARLHDISDRYTNEMVLLI